MKTVTHENRLSFDQHLIHNGFEIDSLFYGLSKIPWQIFLTTHFKTHHRFRPTEEAESNRKDTVHRLMRRTSEALKLSSNDLQYFGLTENIEDRCHYHTLIYVKSKARKDPQDVMEAIRERINWYEVMRPERGSEEFIQIIKSPVDAAAYICKLNRTNLEFKWDHHSKDFYRFYENFTKYNPQDMSVIGAC